MSARAMNVLNVGALMMSSALVAYSSPAFAQDAPDEARTDNEIVVTAQRREQTLQEVPISVGVLSAETLDMAQFSDSRGLAQLSASVNFQEGFSSTASNFSIRGVGAYSFEGGIQPGVSLVVDGVPLARAGEFASDLADIQRIEVLRGPQGTLFGRNATGGAINIVRNRPTDHFEGSLEAGWTTDEELLTRGVISGPLTDGVRGRLAGLYIDRGAYIENIGEGGDAGGMTATGFVGQLEFDLSDAVNLRLTADYLDREHGQGASSTVIPEVIRTPAPFDPTGEARAFALGNGDVVYGRTFYNDPFRINQNKAQDENTDELSGVAAELNWDINNELTLTSVSSYREFYNTANPDVDGTPADGDNLIMPIISVYTSVGPNGNEFTRSVESNYFTQELRLTATGDRVDWILGGFYQQYEELVLNEVPLLIIDTFLDPATGGAALGGTATPNDEYFIINDPLRNSYELTTFAAFGDATVHLTDALDIFGGLRWTQEELDISLNNQRIFAPLTFAEIATRFDSATHVLDVSGLPIFPATADSVGTASTDSAEWSARLGLSYDFSDDVNFYTSYARGHVGPAANLSRTSTLATAFLDPTIANSYEIGLKSSFADGRVTLNMAAFYQEITDLQTSALIPGTTQTEAQNAGDLEISGFEVDFRWRPTDAFSIFGDVSWNDSQIRNLLQPCYFDQLSGGTGCDIDQDGDLTPDSQDVSGRRPINSPELSYNISALYEVEPANLPFNLYGLVHYYYQSEVGFDLKQDDLAVQDAYGLLNVTLGLRDREGGYEFQLYGRNVTDQFYVADAFEAFGALGRLSVRVPRGAQAYYGARLRLFF